MSNELIKALEEYNTIEAIKIINKGFDIESHDKHGRNALHLSCESGLSEVSQFLIKKNFPVNIPGEYGNYPIHCAVLSGDIKIVKKLLNAGQEVNIKNFDGDTPLHISVKEGQNEISLFLMDKADINAENNEGLTPIQCFTSDTSQEVIQQLIKHGADIFRKDKYGNNLLHLAALQNYFNINLEDIVELAYQSGLNINEKNKNNETPLLVAVDNKNSFFVSFYLTFKSKLIEEEKNILFNAVDNDDCRTVELLSQMSIELLDKEKDKKNILFFAESNNMLHLLINLGVDINFQTETGITKLHKSVLENKIDFVELLIQHGADMNLSDNNGNKPIHLTLLGDRKDIAHLLIKNNAILNEPNKMGLIPLNELNTEEIRIIKEMEALSHDIKRKKTIN